MFWLSSRLSVSYAKIAGKNNGVAPMPIDLDELAPRKPKQETVLGQDLSTMSAHELEARIADREAEIARTKEALRSRSATKNAADAFFKR
jgi:uncharacterized small protein (DUF1192 family)